MATVANSQQSASFSPLLNTLPNHNATPKCDACGAELFRHDSPPTGEKNDDNDDQHLVEKGLRKAVDRLTGHKR